MMNVLAVHCYSSNVIAHMTTPRLYIDKKHTKKSFKLTNNTQAVKQSMDDQYVYRGQSFTILQAILHVTDHTGKLRLNFILT